MASRRTRQGDQWKTFTVTVTEVRGEADIHARVALSDVSGVDGRPFRPRVIWEGTIARRLPGSHLSADEAAEYASHAIRTAYPGLF